MPVPRAGTALALVLAFGSPAAAQPRLGPVHTRRLDNGLTVILAPVPADRGIVSVRLRVHVGSSADPRDAVGLAHLVEHMVATLPWDPRGDVFDYACLRAPRVSCNASTRPDETDFYVTLPAERLQLALWAHAQFLGAEADDFLHVSAARERAIVRNEVRQKLDGVPYARALVRLDELMGTRVEGVGSGEDSAQALDGIEEGRIAAFYAQHYGPGAATLVITGDFLVGFAEEVIEETVARVPRSPVRPTAIAAPAGPVRAQRVTHAERPGVAPALLMAWRTPALFAPGDAAGDIAASVLAGPGGRLRARLTRLDGPAAGVSARQESRRGTSAFVIRAMARPGRSLQAIEAEIDQALQELATTEITPDELAAAQALRLTELAEFLETPGERAAAFLTWHEYGPDPAAGFARDWDRYRKVDAAGVRAFVRDHLIPSRRVIVEAASPGTAQP